MIDADLTARKVLMAAYLYYKRDTPVLSDAENDELCEALADWWPLVPARYKPLLDPDMTEGEALRTTSHHCKFTRMVEGGALQWLKSEKSIELKRLNADYYELDQGEIDLHEMMN